MNLRMPTLLGFILVLALLSGCASYQLGNPVNLGYDSVYVKPVRNDSTYPLLEQILTTSIINAINESGTIRTTNQSDAQSILEVVVANADREIAAVTSQDVGRGRKFEMNFEVLCSLYPNDGSNQAIFRGRPVRISQDIFSDSGQVNAEHQAGPEIARKISLKVANLFSDSW